jgi:hypothetical protein
VWDVFTLDLEFHKFSVHKQQLIEFFDRIAEFSQDEHFKQYRSTLNAMSSVRELKDFDPLVAFLRSFYAQELQLLKSKHDGEAEGASKRGPMERVDFIS